MVTSPSEGKAYQRLRQAQGRARRASRQGVRFAPHVKLVDKLSVITTYFVVNTDVQKPLRHRHFYSFYIYISRVVV